MKWRTNMKFCDMPYQRIDFAEAKKELNALMEEFKQAEDAEALGATVIHL